MPDRTHRPADVGERFTLARLCAYKRLYRAAARFYAKAQAEAQGDDGLRAAHRYDAVLTTAQAAAGAGDDAKSLDDAERARLRARARAWLRAELRAWSERGEMGPPQERLAALKALRGMRSESAQAGLRDAALAALPGAERAAWQRFWADLARVLEKLDRRNQRGTQCRSTRAGPLPVSRGACRAASGSACARAGTGA